MPRNRVYDNVDYIPADGKGLIMWFYHVDVFGVCIAPETSPQLDGKWVPTSLY